MLQFRKASWCNNLPEHGVPLLHLPWDHFGVVPSDNPFFGSYYSNMGNILSFVDWVGCTSKSFLISSSYGCINFDKWHDDNVVHHCEQSFLGS